MAEKVSSLAETWEQDHVIRGRARVTGQVTAWAESNLVGVCNEKSLLLNRNVLEHLARYWCSQSKSPQCAPIDMVRNEVKAFRRLMNLDVGNKAVLHMDSWGLKKLFSHAFRRWNSASAPRESSLNVLWGIFDEHWTPESPEGNGPAPSPATESSTPSTTLSDQVINLDDGDESLPSTSATPAASPMPTSVSSTPSLDKRIEALRLELESRGALLAPPATPRDRPGEGSAADTMQTIPFELTYPDEAAEVGAHAEVAEAAGNEVHDQPVASDAYEIELSDTLPDEEMEGDLPTGEENAMEKDAEVAKVFQDKESSELSSATLFYEGPEGNGCHQPSAEEPDRIMKVPEVIAKKEVPVNPTETQQVSLANGGASTEAQPPVEMQAAIAPEAPMEVVEVESKAEVPEEAQAEVPEEAKAEVPEEAKAEVPDARGKLLQSKPPVVPRQEQLASEKSAPKSKRRRAADKVVEVDESGQEDGESVQEVEHAAPAAPAAPARKRQRSNKKDSKAAEGEVNPEKPENATFARRYCPKGEIQSAKWHAIKDVFDLMLKPLPGSNFGLQDMREVADYDGFHLVSMNVAVQMISELGH